MERAVTLVLTLESQGNISKRGGGGEGSCSLRVTDFERSSLGLWGPEGEMWRENCKSEPKW